MYAKIPAVRRHLRQDFTLPELLEKIKAKGVNIGYVTLHVGLGTFRPVKADDILEHKMHSEFYILLPETADLVNKTKSNGKRVISVGTTATRVLKRSEWKTKT